MRNRLLVVALFITSSAVAGEVTTLSGQKHTGDVIAVSPQAITLKNVDKEVSIPIADALLVDLAIQNPPRDKHSEVELIDGSVLACSAVTIKNQSAELTLTSGNSITTPLAAIRSVLNDAHDGTTRQQWQILLRQRGPLDMLVVKSDGKLDALDGTFGAGNDVGDSIEFSLSANDQKLAPKLARLQGMLFVRKPDPSAPPVFCKIADLAGSVVVAKSARIEGNNLIADLVAGASITVPLSKVARLDFSKGKLTYLSDLEPIEKEQSSTEELIFPIRRDRNLYGGPLRLNGVAYSKGLAIHSRTALTYDIGGEYKELRAIVGVDDVVRTESGSPVRVALRIEGDGRELHNGEVKTGDEPKPLAVDVKGVRKVRITVAAPLLDLGNQLNLCDLRVTK